MFGSSQLMSIFTLAENPLQKMAEFSKFQWSSEQLTKIAEITLIKSIQVKRGSTRAAGITLPISCSLYPDLPVIQIPFKFFKSWVVWQNEKDSVPAKSRTSSQGATLKREQLWKVASITKTPIRDHQSKYRHIGLNFQFRAVAT